MSLAVPPQHANAKRETRTEARWHEYAFPLLPAPFGEKMSLDVGCGGGGVLMKQRELGWSATGLDISPNNIETIRALGFPGEAVDLNGEFPVGSETFDFVSCVEVVEHLVRAEHAFAEIARVIKPGGRFLLTTPNNALFRRRLKALKGRAPDDEGYHFRFWVKQELEKILSTAGFAIIARNSYGYLPWIDLLKLSKLRTGKRGVYPITESMEALFSDRFVWLLAKEG